MMSRCELHTMVLSGVGYLVVCGKNLVEGRL